MAEPNAELVRRAQAGDREALVELVGTQQSYVYSIAMGVMRNPTDAADMTQEAFVRLIRALHTFRGETRFTTWLYRLVTNVCLDGLRRRGRPVDSLDVPDAEDDAVGERLPDDDRWGDPEASAARQESAEEVRGALEQLPVAQRLALTMFYFQEARYEEIALAMDLPINTVKSHIRRGKERLALILRTRGNGKETVHAL